MQACSQAIAVHTWKKMQCKRFKCLSKKTHKIQYNNKYTLLKETLSLDSSFFLSIKILLLLFSFLLKPQKKKQWEVRYSQDSDANCYICGRVVVKGRRGKWRWVREEIGFSQPFLCVPKATCQSSGWVS